MLVKPHPGQEPGDNKYLMVSVCVRVCVRARRVKDKPWYGCVQHTVREGGGIRREGEGRWVSKEARDSGREREKRAEREREGGCVRAL